MIDKTERFAKALAGPTLVTDGTCNLCTGAASFIQSRLDPSTRVYYMWAQHADTMELLKPLGVTRDDLMQSWALLYKYQVLRGSDAWVAVGQFLQQPWRSLFAMVGFVPRIVREGVYGCVASSRYHIFGGTESCQRPDEARNKFFLHSVD